MDVMNAGWKPEEREGQAELLKKAVERLRKEEGTPQPEQSERTISSTAKRRLQKKPKGKT
jgi:hypothetical protein